VAGFRAQKCALEAAGRTKIFAEQISSVLQRYRLESSLDYLRDGRARGEHARQAGALMRDLLGIVAKIEAKSASLRILAMNLDTTAATGKLYAERLGQRRRV
jgi:hypothetical protein